LAGASKGGKRMKGRKVEGVFPFSFVATSGSSCPKKKKNKRKGGKGKRDMNGRGALKKTGRRRDSLAFFTWPSYPAQEKLRGERGGEKGRRFFVGCSQQEQTDN